MKAACDSFIRLSIQWLVDYVFPSDEQHIMAHLQLPCYVNKIYIFMPHFWCHMLREQAHPYRAFILCRGKQTNKFQSINKIEKNLSKFLEPLMIFYALRCKVCYSFFSSCCCCIMRLIGIAIVAPASLLMDLPGCKTIASAESWKTMATPCNGYSCHIVASCSCVCVCMCVRACFMLCIRHAAQTKRAGKMQTGNWQQLWEKS